MRRLALLALIGALALAVVDARAADAPLLRTTLIVADAGRSLAFYRLLGFEPVEEMGGGRDPQSPFPLSAASRRFRLVILADAKRSPARIGILQFDDPSPAARAPRRRVGIGDMVFVIDVADAAATHAALVAAGADIVEAPQVYRSRQLDDRGRPWEGHVFHVFDPDGYLVELLEAPKALPRP